MEGVDWPSLRQRGPSKILQRSPDLRSHDVFSLIDVSGGESQELETGVEQQVLSAVVLYEPLPMVDAVVFDNEARGRVIDVGSADKVVVGVTKLDLRLRPRQAGFQQQPSKAGFHR